MTLPNIRLWIIRLLVGYLIIGSIYYVSGYLFNLFIGKDIVFDPIVGFPLTVMSWPMMVFGDLANVQSLGIRPPTVLTLLSLAAIITFVILKVMKDQ